MMKIRDVFATLSEFMKKTRTEFHKRYRKAFPDRCGDLEREARKEELRNNFEDWKDDFIPQKRSRNIFQREWFNFYYEFPVTAYAVLLATSKSEFRDECFMPYEIDREILFDNMERELYQDKGNTVIKEVFKGKYDDVVFYEWENEHGYVVIRKPFIQKTEYILTDKCNTDFADMICEMYVEALDNNDFINMAVKIMSYLTEKKWLDNSTFYSNPENTEACYMIIRRVLTSVYSMDVLDAAVKQNTLIKKYEKLLGDMEDYFNPKIDAETSYCFNTVVEYIENISRAFSTRDFDVYFNNKAEDNSAIENMLVYRITKTIKRIAEHFDLNMCGLDKTTSIFDIDINDVFGFQTAYGFFYYIEPCHDHAHGKVMYAKKDVEYPPFPEWAHIERLSYQDKIKKIHEEWIDSCGALDIDFANLLVKEGILDEDYNEIKKEEHSAKSIGRTVGYTT